MLPRRLRAPTLILLAALPTFRVQAQQPAEKPVKDREVHVSPLLATFPLWLVCIQEDGRVGGPNPQPTDLESSSWLLWSLLADGSTAASGPYKEPIQRIERWLLGQQDRRGRFAHDSDPRWPVHHARTAAALAADAASTGRSRLANAAESACRDLLELTKGLGERAPDELLFWSFLLADRLIAAEHRIASNQAPCDSEPWVSSGRRLLARVERILDARRTHAEWTPLCALLETLRQPERFGAPPDDRAVAVFANGTTEQSLREPVDSLSELAAVIGFYGHRQDLRLASLWDARQSETLKHLIDSYEDHPLADYWIEGDPQPVVPGDPAELVRGFAFLVLSTTEYYRYSRFPASSFAPR